MKKLSELERAESILSEDDVVSFIKPADRLATPSRDLLGKAFVLTKYQEGFIPTMTYQCVEEEGSFKWKLINYVEESPTAKCSNIWANSVRDADTGRSTVYIHWTDPEDTSSAHWSHSVVVKKRGSVPLSIHDGEIVGRSSVRNQYAGKTGFVDSIDADCTDDNDIIEDLEFPIEREYVRTTDTLRNINKTYYLREGTNWREASGSDFDGGMSAKEFYEDPNRYYYNVFAVSIYGKWIAGDGCGTNLTWLKFKDLVRSGVARSALDIGDIVQIRHDGLGVMLDFQVVAFDNPMPASGKHGVTLMACDAIFRGSFDHSEKEYIPTTDTGWNGSKVYYYHNSVIDAYEVVSDRTTPITAYSKGQVYEKNPIKFPIKGRNSWIDSNARRWLNARNGDWFEATGYDQLSTDLARDGAYGIKAIDGRPERLFSGFLDGIDPEFLEVISQVPVKTTKPIWKRSKETDPQSLDDTTYDFVFLPSYTEVFGHDSTFPTDVADEGEQFEIFKKRLTPTRMKTIISEFNTTHQGEKDAMDNLCSWWLRTPTRTVDVEIGGATIDCVEIVTVKNRRYDDIRDLGEDGATGRQPYMPADDGSGVARDNRDNQFSPVGTSLKFSNNTAPGFVPCVVIGG